MEMTEKEFLIEELKECVEDLNVYQVPAKYVLSRLIKLLIRYLESEEHGCLLTKK